MHHQLPNHKTILSTTSRAGTSTAVHFSGSWFVNYKTTSMNRGESAVWDPPLYVPLMNVRPRSKHELLFWPFTNSLITYLPVLSRGRISFFHYAEGNCKKYDPGIFLLFLRIRSIRGWAGVSLICELPWYKLIKSGEIPSRSGNSAKLRCGGVWETRVVVWLPYFYGPSRSLPFPLFLLA